MTVSENGRATAPSGMQRTDGSEPSGDDCEPTAACSFPERLELAAVASNLKKIKKQSAPVSEG